LVGAGGDASSLWHAPMVMSAATMAAPAANLIALDAAPFARPWSRCVLISLSVWAPASRHVRSYRFAFFPAAGATAEPGG
jgi:hypothetical protein